VTVLPAMSACSSFSLFSPTFAVVYVYSHPSECYMDLVKRQGQSYLSNADLLLGGPPDV